MSLWIISGHLQRIGLLTKALKIQPETDGRLTAPGEC
jgi:hypothetical protein